jgi:hypothetical protein
VRWLFFTSLLALAFVPLGSAHGLSVPGGAYTVIDGPEAGLNFTVGHGGVASILGRTSAAKVIDDDPGCDQAFLTGTIDGQAGPTGFCAWGRTMFLSKVTPLWKATATAITAEDRSVATLTKTPPGALHPELVTSGKVAVEDAQAALAADVKAHSVAGRTAAKIGSRLNAAHAIDVKVEKQLKAGGVDDADRASAVTQLKSALTLKRAALTLIEHAGVATSGLLKTPAPCGTRRIAARTACKTTAFWDVYVPRYTRSALCVAITGNGHVTDSQHPVFPGVTQVQRCKVTSRIKKFGKERLRDVHFLMTLTGTVHGSPKPVRVKVYFPA